VIKPIRLFLQLSNLLTYIFFLERFFISSNNICNRALSPGEGRIGGRRPKLSPEQRKDIVDNVLSERRTGAQMARLYKVSEATISRVIADKRNGSEAV
jgi:hypothetical protein